MLPWRDIDTVLLDMDGTLLDLSFDNFFWLQYLPEKYAQHHQLPLAEASAYLRRLSDEVHGSLAWYCLDHWTRETGLDIEALKHEVQDRIVMRPHVPEFIAWLAGMGKQVMLVTNAHPRALALKSRQSGLHRHLPHMVSSHELALAKENPGFWQQLAEREGLSLANSLLIDDSMPVLARAEAEGVGHMLQMLHPDSTDSIRDRQHFPGIVHFDELM